MYPFWSFIIAVLVAQGLKPFVALKRLKRFSPRLMFSSGGCPSSHSAGVCSLTLAMGLREHFSSPLFALSLALACIVCYDAANVRYYAGKNIALTKQLVDDLSNDHIIDEDKPIYEERIKDVLGHKWSEVLIGGIIGLCIALILFKC